MKVVKIKKDYRGGTKEHYLVILDETYSHEDIECDVDRWCAIDPSGSNYGYTFEWCIIEDKTLINTILKGEIKKLERQIELIQIQKLKIEEEIALQF